MTPEEQKIEEAAKKYANVCYNYIASLIGFTKGALSQEAKEYHTKGMYTEEEVRNLFIERCKALSTKHDKFQQFLLKQDLEWFEQNKKK